jgi:hypothetical protein
VFATVLELDPRARDKVSHSPGHQNLTGFGVLGHPRSNMHSNAANIVAT